MVRLFAALSLLCNGAVFFATAFCIAQRHLKKNEEESELGYYRYFTVESNLFGALCALISAFFAFRTLQSGVPTAPVWAACLKYMATAALTLTFLTVALYLVRVYGAAAMYQRHNLWMHLLTPLFSLVSFLIFDQNPALPLWMILLGMIPTAIYGGIYVINVVYRKRWQDFYGFLQFPHWPFTFFVMILFSGLLCLALWGAHEWLFE